jgi:hypothetical protein
MSCMGLTSLIMMYTAATSIGAKFFLTLHTFVGEMYSVINHTMLYCSSAGQCCLDLIYNGDSLWGCNAVELVYL